MPSSRRRESEKRGAVSRAVAEIFRSEPLTRLVGAGSTEEIRDALLALVLGAAAGVVLPNEAGSSEAGLRPSERLARTFSRGRASLLKAGATSHALTAERPEFDSALRLAEWLPEDATPALFDALRLHDGDLGACYEELLELGVRELDGPSVRVKPDGVWVSVRALLATKDTARSKTLTRQTGLPKTAVARLAVPLARARTDGDVVEALESVRVKGSPLGVRGAIVLEANGARRRSGSHYTPRALSRTVLERTLAPLFDDLDGEGLLELRICDPAMGSGAFLVEAAEFLAARVVSALERRAATVTSAAERRRVLRRVVGTCLYGVDKDPIAVDLTRWSLARLVDFPEDLARDLSVRLCAGDALMGSVAADDANDTPSGTVAFHWAARFPDVFENGRRGFDACVGNPPWVAYAGRAAQPLARDVAAYYERTNPAFFGYRTLHGLFTRRAAEILRPGGRLGLVVPTSMADLDGYAPARRAHDALSVIDRDLVDFGNGAFDGVFQPCMAVTSTRRSGDEPAPSSQTWTVARTDLDDASRHLLARLELVPKLPPTLFGERGFQTTGDDLAHIRRLDGPEPPFDVPIREGVDVVEFEAHPARAFIDTSTLRGRFRTASDWRRVAVLIRQTARFPIAALADGTPFRNSILAGFASDAWSAAALVAYLNSSAVRFYHFNRHRDARQGMPQLKIGHLRAMPDVTHASHRARLDAFGSAHSGLQRALRPDERKALDAIAFDALGFTEPERELASNWAASHPPPRSRR